MNTMEVFLSLWILSLCWRGKYNIYGEVFFLLNRKICQQPEKHDLPPLTHTG